MITERTIINALLITAAFVLVPFVISETLSLDYLPALIAVGLFALGFAFFVLKDSLCIWPLLGTSIVGVFHFLPVGVDIASVCCALLVAYYFLNYILLRQAGFKLGKAQFFWPILVVLVIVLYHNHSLNVGAVGGAEEGGKPAFVLYVAVLAYFCGINIRSPSVQVMSRIPLYVVIATAVSSLPFFVTSIIPSLAPYVYVFDNAVNVDAYVSSQATDVETGVGRLGPFGQLGAVLQVYLLCHYPIGTWLRPNRLWIPLVSSICLFLALASGFRNMLFSYTLTFIICSLGYYSWRAFFLPIAGVVGLCILLAGSSNGIIPLPVNKLPMIAQRTMSFLPFDWDPEAVESAKGSSDFRKNIQDVYIAEYLYKSPLIGNGFSIDTKTFNALNNALMHKGPGAGKDPDYLISKVFIEGKLFHTGWVSVYDIVGLIGGAAFVILGWNEIWEAARFVFGPRINRQSTLFPVYVWLLANIGNSMIAFFTVFGDFGVTFKYLCIYGIVLSQLSDVRKSAQATVAAPERKGEIELDRLSGAHYGYKSQS